MHSHCLTAVAAILLAAGAGTTAAANELYDATQESGLAFTHVNGMSGELLFPEMTGQGAAFFDYDGDGDLDAYLVQGGRLGQSVAGASEAIELDTLLRNDSSSGGVRWVDVTASSGLRADGYGMAVAIGDVDGDGWSDLFLGNYGPNQLWRNRGDGTFEDISRQLGESSSRWTTAGAFVDLDGDARQDLYVVNYVDYDIVEAPTCYATSSRRDYCGPSGFTPQADRLLRNLGDGRFEDASSSSGIASQLGAGLGVVVLDADGDRRLDLYVANDGQANFLWRYLGNGWVDDALIAGVAVNRRGEAEASMGLALGDFDRDGDEDLFVTHLSGESNTLYVNLGDGLFDDRTIEQGLAGPSLSRTAFGVVWTDFDHDGWLDLAVANGAVRIQEEQAVAGDDYPLSQANQLFVNSSGTFGEVDATTFARPSEVGRGLVDGDVDNDGDRDLLLTNSAGPARLFLSGGAEGENWMGVSLTRPAHQAVTASYADTRLTLRASTTGSYASAVDSRVVIPGGESPNELLIEGDGRRLRFERPRLGRYFRFDLARERP